MREPRFYRPPAMLGLPPDMCTVKHRNRPVRPFHLAAVRRKIAAMLGVGVAAALLIVGSARVPSPGPAPARHPPPPPDPGDGALLRRKPVATPLPERAARQDRPLPLVAGPPGRALHQHRRRAGRLGSPPRRRGRGGRRTRARRGALPHRHAGRYAPPPRGTRPGAG